MTWTSSRARPKKLATSSHHWSSSARVGTTTSVVSGCSLSMQESAKTVLPPPVTIPTITRWPAASHFGSANRCHSRNGSFATLHLLTGYSPELAAPDKGQNLLLAALQPHFRCAGRRP